MCSYLHTEPVWEAPSNVTRMDPLSQTLRHQKTQGKVTIKDKNSMPEEGWKTFILFCISLHVCVYTLTLFIYHGTYPLTLCNSVFLYIHKVMKPSRYSILEYSYYFKNNALPVALLFFVHPPTLGNINLLSISADVPTVGISDHM